VWKTQPLSLFHDGGCLIQVVYVAIGLFGMGLTICHKNEFVQSQFSDGGLNQKIVSRKGFQLLPPPPHLLRQWPFYLYTRQELELYELVYTNSYIGVARCTLKVGAAGCTLTVGAAGNTNCTP